MIRNGAGEVSTEIPLSFMFETSCHTTCLHGGTCVDISVCLCSDLYQGASCESESERTVGMCICGSRVSVVRPVPGGQSCGYVYLWV